MAMKLSGLLIAALLSTCLGSAARADLITWTLNGVTLTDGATMSGSFVVDTVGDVTAWDITSTPGALPGFHYTSANPSYNFSNVSANILNVGDSATMNEIELTFDNSLTTPSQNNTLFLAGSYEYEASTTTYRYPTAGAADSSPNPGPLPGGGLLSYLIVGFGGLAAGRKKAFAWAKSSVAAGRARRRRVHAVGCSPA